MKIQQIVMQVNLLGEKSVNGRVHKVIGRKIVDLLLQLPLLPSHSQCR